MFHKGAYLDPARGCMISKDTTRYFDVWLMHIKKPGLQPVRRTA